MTDKKLKVNNSNVLIKKEDFTGIASTTAELVTGARLLFTLYISSIDPGAQVSVSLKHSFSQDVPFQEFDTIVSNSIGHASKIATDIHNQLQFVATVTGGNASFYLGVSIYDNAVASQVDARIENAELNVDLNHIQQANGRFDSVRIGNGTRELQINEDGSLSTVDGNTTGYKRFLNPILKNASEESEMNVNGSVTPVEFYYNIPAGKTLLLESLSILLIDIGSIDPEDFGAISDGLINGLEIITQVNGASYTLAEIFNNSELALLFNSDSGDDRNNGFLNSESQFKGRFPFPKPILMEGDQGDFIKVIVKDDLTGLNVFKMSSMFWEGL